MAITVNHATLARQVNNVIEYIYPKTDATLVKYDSNQNVKEKIDSLSANVAENKVDKPVDEDGAVYDGSSGQVLETNGDGTTSWVTRAKIYIGSDEMPEGYDFQIDPDATAIEIDRSLSVDGAVAEASATGAAINLTREKITSQIETHNTDIAAHLDIRAMITDAKKYLLLIDAVTGEEVKVTVEDGQLVCSPAVIKCTGITITTNPTKTSYDVGEVFDPAGMVVTATYNDNTTKVVTGYTYPTMGLTAGTTSVTIAYIEGGVTVTATVPVTVVVKCIGINVSTMPVMTQYYIGEVFNPTGMIISATYTDDTVKAVTNYTYPTTAVTSSTKSIKISYVEDGTTFTATVPITVIAKCTGITLTTNPTKVQYTEGEVFNPAGMVITASYNDETTKAVTGYAYPTTALALGTTSIPISYTATGTTFTVNVPITVVSAFDAATVLQDFTYSANGDGTYTITGWKGTKNGIVSTEVVVPDSKYVVVNPSV